MNKIKLKFKSISEIVGSPGLALLVLTDEAEKRQISIVCDQVAAHQLMLRTGNVGPTQTLLPEALWQLLRMHTHLSYEILINGLAGGQYKAIVYDTESLTPVSVGIVDAVMLSMIAPIPLYIDETLMCRQSVIFKEGCEGIAIPVNTLNKEMLEDALKKAIEHENYELASHLRDEMRRRHLDHPAK